MPKYTSLVRLETSVKQALDDIGKKKETYSDIIGRLLESFKEVNHKRELPKDWQGFASNREVSE